MADLFLSTCWKIFSFSSKLRDGVSDEEAVCCCAGGAEGCAHTGITSWLLEDAAASFSPPKVGSEKLLKA